MRQFPFGRSLLARVVVGLVLLSVPVGGLAGCGVRADHTAGAEQGVAEATLPTLPPAEERLDDLYDDEGCLLLSDGPPDCSASADALDRALAGAQGRDVRTLAGFVGPLFVTDLPAGVVTVLEGTVAEATTGPWRASGLVRNETTSPVAAPTVTATLRAADGSALGDAAATVAVAPVRPGEPAPFTVRSEVDAAAVASVDWAVTEGGGVLPSGTRDLELTTYFAAPAGARDPLDLYLYQETGAGPHPFVLFGSVANLADVAAPSPTVVAAWLDAEGRVRTITEAGTTEPDGSTSRSLRAGGSADFLLRVDDPLAAEGLESDQVLLWAVSR